jgi:hypothetical protein
VMGRPTGGQRALPRWEVEHDIVCSDRAIDETCQRRWDAGWLFEGMMAVGRMTKLLWRREKREADLSIPTTSQGQTSK